MSIRVHTTTADRVSLSVLTVDQLNELFERAHIVWERAKVRV